MAKCTGCGVHIPDINVEFGGPHHYTLDGDLYCSTDCLRTSMNATLKAVETEEGFYRYMGVNKEDFE